MDGIPGIGASLAQTAATAAGTARLEARADELRRSGAETDAAQRFEELLATLLVKELRRALPDGLFGQGPGADVYEGWFDEHLGRDLARGGGLGLAEIVRESLVRKGEARSRQVEGGA